MLYSRVMYCFFLPALWPSQMTQELRCIKRAIRAPGRSVPGRAFVLVLIVLVIPAIVEGDFLIPCNRSDRIQVGVPPVGVGGRAVVEEAHLVLAIDSLPTIAFLVPEPEDMHPVLLGRRAEVAADIVVGLDRGARKQAATMDSGPGDIDPGIVVVVVFGRCGFPDGFTHIAFLGSLPAFGSGVSSNAGFREL